MNTERQIDRIINIKLPAILDGEETLESILAKYPRYVGELRPRLEAALWLQHTKTTLEPRPGYIISSRKYLETQIESMPAVGFWRNLIKRYSPQRWVFNITAPIIVFLLFVLVINSTVLTARLSIPGDPFYTTKLVIEDVQLALTFNQVDQTDLHIQFTRERALEFVALVMEGNYEYLPVTSTRMETEIIASLHSLDALSLNNSQSLPLQVDNLRDTLSYEITMLNVLKKTSPTYAWSGIELAINVTQSGLMALR